MELWVARDAGSYEGAQGDITLYLDKPEWTNNRFMLADVYNAKNRYQPLFNRELFPEIKVGECKQIEAIIFKEE